MLGTVSGSLSDLSKTSLSQSASLSQAADSSSTSVGVVAATTEELSASIKEINMQITNSSMMASDAASKSSLATDAIKHLQDGAEKIGDIVKFIRTIAEQTNLLALNATIEAARAGDAGKGFSVVAAEVKDLANKTASATAEISSYVTNVLQAIDSTVRVMNDIGGSISTINSSSGSIAAAMEEQSAAIDEILRSMHNAAKGAQETHDATNSIVETAKSTNGMADTLGQASSELMRKGLVLTHELDTFLSNLKTQ
jgi:methyl-accepting chemotaxis protein